MIHLKYEREKNSTVVYVDNLLMFGIEKVKIEFKNIITDEIHFTTYLHSNMWTNWQGAELITDVYVYSDQGNLLKKFIWDVTENGDQIEKILWYYLLERKNNKIPSYGLVIGSHDGRNGHWIYGVKENLTKVTLVDGGDKQFKDLQKNYSLYNNVELKNEIITPEGGEVTWYQGGEGYTDTVIPELIHDWLEPNKIKSGTKKSVSINSIMKNKNYDWLHLDVEGIDNQLIMSLESRPNIIIYESMNFSKKETQDLNYWFGLNSYETLTINGNTMAKKNEYKI